VTIAARAIAITRRIRARRAVRYTSDVVEREIKLRFESADEARRAVARLDARPLAARRLQDDCLLDRDDAELRTGGCALRIRRDGASARVTFKGPVMPGPMKMREELETGVDNADILAALFAALGYTPRFRYQKYREEFSLPNLVIAIDETPIGTFVELEGEEMAIGEAAARLGRSPVDYVFGSYRTLFVEARQAQGLPDGDMVFDA
jgi:adenylate cyclase, class 2